MKIYTSSKFDLPAKALVSAGPKMEKFPELKNALQKFDQEAHLE